MGIRVFFEGKKIIIRVHQQFRVILKDQIQNNCWIQYSKNLKEPSAFMKELAVLWGVI
jgi:hypothetical protein